jgi:hypothetical protein
MLWGVMNRETNYTLLLLPRKDEFNQDYLRILFDAFFGGGVWPTCRLSSVHESRFYSMG